MYGGEEGGEEDATVTGIVIMNANKKLFRGDPSWSVCLSVCLCNNRMLPSVRPSVWDDDDDQIWNCRNAVAPCFANKGDLLA